MVGEEPCKGRDNEKTGENADAAHQRNLALMGLPMIRRINQPNSRCQSAGHVYQHSGKRYR